METKKILTVLTLSILMLTQNVFAQKLREETKAGKKYIIHRVQTGETLYRLTKAYSVSKEDLIANNPGIDKILKIGTEVKIPNGELTLPTKLQAKPDATESEVFNITHTVQKGEWLTKIAKSYDVSVDELKKWNDLKKETIKPGQELIVGTKTRRKTKVSSKTKGTYAQNNKKKNNVKTYKTPAPLQEIIHEVKPKESLASIKRTYSVSIADLKTWNGLTSDNIKVGQKLKVYQEPKPSINKDEITENPYANNTNTVTTPNNTGGNPFDLNNSNNTTPNNTGGNPFDLNNSNNTTPNNTTMRGKTNTPAIKVATSVPVIHTVKAGETIYSIQNQYNIRKTELRVWNGIPSGSNDIKVGQKLKVYIPQKVTYTLQAGETLEQVSQKYNVNKRQIEIWNKIDPRTIVRPGTPLTLFLSTGPKPNTTMPNLQASNTTTYANSGTFSMPIVYKVQAGDNISRISSQFNVGRSEIAYWNNLEWDNSGSSRDIKIYTGEDFLIYKPRKETYIVKKGDTFDKIAKMKVLAHPDLAILQQLKQGRVDKNGNPRDEVAKFKRKMIIWNKLTPPKPHLPIGKELVFYMPTGPIEGTNRDANYTPPTIEQVKSRGVATSNTTIVKNIPPVNTNQNTGFNALNTNQNTNVAQNNPNTTYRANPNTSTNSTVYRGSPTTNTTTYKANNPQTTTYPKQDNPFTGNPYTQNTRQSDDPFADLNNQINNPSNNTRGNNNYNSSYNSNTDKYMNNNTRGKDNNSGYNTNQYMSNNNTRENNSNIGITNKLNVIQTGFADVIDEVRSSKPYVAVHRTAAIGTLILVKNPANNKSAVVEVVAQLNPADVNYNDNTIIQVTSATFTRLSAPSGRLLPVEISYMPKR